MTRQSCRIGATLALTLWASQLPASTITVSSPTTSFRPVTFGNQNDYFLDQQTGHRTGDIVGDAQNPGFYTAFDGVQTFYRVRLGAVDYKGNNIGFNGVFWLGIDANSDGGLDLFIAVNNSGNSSALTFHAPGSGLNNSPSNTTIENYLPKYSIAQTSANYHYAPVSAALHPDTTAIDFDLDGDGSEIDAFLTFGIPFFGTSGSTTLQGALAGLANINVGTHTPFSYVIATSRQDNALNQDIGGVNNKTFDQNLTWRQLGATSSLAYIDGSLATPEPGTYLMLGAGLVLLALARRSSR